jgi:gas vesicle protein
MRRVRDSNPRWNAARGIDLLAFDIYPTRNDNQSICRYLLKGEHMSDETGTGEKALYFVLGAFIGAATALLLAPRSGEETRKLLTVKAKEGAELVSNRSRTVAEKATSYVDRGKDLLQQQREQLSAAIEAGKQAYLEEKEKAKV